MNDQEKYLFDVQGYLVVKNVLTKEKLASLNRAIDMNMEQGVERQKSFMVWKENDFRDLIDDPIIVPYLSEMLKQEYRLDHEYTLIQRKGHPPLGLHGGGIPYDPGQFYVFKDGQMFNGLTVVSYALTDIGPEDGGFCCIPGSHKANYPVPDAFKNYTEIGATVHIEQKAGDVLIFTEALTHGTFPWQGAHERRSVLYKYAPSMISWRAFERPQELMDLLTDQQKIIVQTPSSKYYRYYGGVTTKK